MEIFRQAASFVDGMGKRLLAEDVFAFLHRGSGDGRVQVVRGANDYRI